MPTKKQVRSFASRKIFWCLKNTSLRIWVAVADLRNFIRIIISEALATSADSFNYLQVHARRGRERKEEDEEDSLKMHLALNVVYSDILAGKYDLYEDSSRRK